MKSFAITTYDPANSSTWTTFCFGDSIEDAKKKYMDEHYWLTFCTISELN